MVGETAAPKVVLKSNRYVLHLHTLSTVPKIQAALFAHENPGAKNAHDSDRDQARYTPRDHQAI